VAAARSSETFPTYQTTRRHNPEDRNPNGFMLFVISYYQGIADDAKDAQMFVFYIGFENICRPVEMYLGYQTTFGFLLNVTHVTSLS
jgi:hypothetical protein